VKNKFNNFYKELNSLGKIQHRLCDDYLDLLPNTLQTLIVLKERQLTYIMLL